MSKRILIIEDEEIIAAVLEDSLELLGHDITIASSGEEGIRRAQQLHPDIITLDVMMPGLDGIQVLRELKSNESTRNIPVILVSVAGSPYKEQGLQLGAVAFMKKPVDFKLLNEKIMEVTQKKSVLVVEDNPELLMLIEVRMKAMGYHVSCVKSGEEAIVKAKEMHPDIILMDVVLPEENGFDITKQLKEDKDLANIPVIAFSGYFSEDIDSKKVIGVDKFLEKEFSAEDLAKEVTEVLKKYE